MVYIISAFLYGFTILTISVFMCYDIDTGKVILANFIPSLMSIKWQIHLGLLLIFSMFPFYFGTKYDLNNKARKKQVKGDLHGSGAWGTKENAKEEYYEFNFKDFHSDLKVPSGWLVYYDESTNTHYFDITLVSTVTLAPARRYKTSSISLPEIMYNMMSDASMFIPDTKGEMLDYLKPLLDKKNIRCVNYNLDDTEYSDKYNLIGDVSDSWDRHIAALKVGNITESNKALALCQQNALIIAEQMIISTKRDDTSSMHNFFFGTSIGWIASCILLVVQYAPRHLRHFPSVVSICRDLAVRSTKHNQLGAVLSFLDKDNLAVSVAGGAGVAEEELLINVISSVQDSMLPFENKSLLNVFNTYQSNNLEKSVKEQTFTFLNFPLNNPTAGSIASLMISQHVEGLAIIAKQSISDNPDEVGVLPRHYRFELEEIGNIPAIKNMEKYLSLYQGFKMTFSLVFQDYSQLKDKYGSKADTILKNADIKRYLGFNADDVEFGKRVSQALGTITVESTSQSSSYNSHGYGTRTNHSTSKNLIKRELMTIEEVLQTKKAIIMKSPHKPLKTRFIRHFDDAFPVTLSRSGFKGHDHGFENIEVYSWEELTSSLSTNSLPRNENDDSVMDRIKLIDIFGEYKLPYAKEFLAGNLNDDMKRKLELSLIGINEEYAHMITELL